MLAQTSLVAGVIYGVHVPCIWLLWCALSGLHTPYHTPQFIIHRPERVVTFLNQSMYGLNVILEQKSANLSRDQILTKIIQARGKTLYSKIYELIHSIWNKNKLSQQWKKTITQPH